MEVAWSDDDSCSPMVTPVPAGGALSAPSPSEGLRPVDLRGALDTSSASEHVCKSASGHGPGIQSFMVSELQGERAEKEVARSGLKSAVCSVATD